MILELTKGRKIIKQYSYIDVVYTLFGIGLCPKSCKSEVSGLRRFQHFFPEINFWDGYTGLARLKKTIVDKYRILAFKKSEMPELCLKTEAMLTRSKKNFFNFPIPYLVNHRSILIFLRPHSNYLLLVQILKIGLFLCGWQKNKNYMLIPEILSEFKKGNKISYSYWTAPKSEKISYTEFMDKVNSFDVEDRITVLGPVKKTELKSNFIKILIMYSC